jgi:hypothetical protein
MTHVGQDPPETVSISFVADDAGQKRPARQFSLLCVKLGRHCFLESNDESAADCDERGSGVSIFEILVPLALI